MKELMGSVMSPWECRCVDLSRPLSCRPVRVSGQLAMVSDEVLLSLIREPFKLISFRTARLLLGAIAHNTGLPTREESRKGVGF